MQKGTIEEVLISSEDINARVAELGAEISRDYRAKTLTAVCLLKGSFIFAADLVRAISEPVTIEFMRASSYGGSTESSGSVKILLDLDEDIGGKDVLVIEDIVDTGRTLRRILDLLEFRHPKSLRICSLLDKPSRRVTPIPIEYRGFTIPDKFVVGYGLDYDEYYRNLPYIGVLNPA